MFDIAISVAFYTAVGLLYKLGGKQGRNLLATNLAVFAAGTLAALAFGALTQGLALDRKAAGFGAAAGLASVAANIAFLLAVRSGRLAVSWTVFNMALIVPVVVAMLVWGEGVTLQRVLGIAVTLTALLLLGADKSRAETQTGAAGAGLAWRCLIAAAFLSNGMLMTLNKAFKSSGSVGGPFGYLAVYFGVGLAVSILLHAWYRPVVAWRDAAIGAGIGAFSVLGAFFLLRALSHQPATLVFPASSAGNLVLVALLSAPLFRETLSWKGWSGVALGAVALALMN